MEMSTDAAATIMQTARPGKAAGATAAGAAVARIRIRIDPERVPEPAQRPRGARLVRGNHSLPLNHTSAQRCAAEAASRRLVSSCSLSFVCLLLHRSYLPPPSSTAARRLCCCCCCCSSAAD